jgi:DNA-binding transcriptional LysR family regulator
VLDRVTGLQVFIRVASLGSLTAAARSLGMSQTMATKHIAAIEGRLGVRLLNRSTRRLSLTEAGRGYLEASERILAEIEEADRAAAAAALEVTGTLRLSVPVSFGIREVAPLLPQLLQRHPSLSIELGLNDRYVDLIEEGWDLAVRIGILPSSSLVARRIAPCRTLVCASPAYLEAHGTPSTVGNLAHHACLIYTLSRASDPRVWVFGKKGDLRVSVKGMLAANNGDALVAAAVAGQGIIYGPAFMLAHEVRAGRLTELMLDHPTMPLDGVFAVYPANRRPPAKVRACIDFLAEKLSPVPPWERATSAASGSRP